MGTGAAGGRTAKGMLMPGAVAQKGKYGGASAFGNSGYSAASNKNYGAAADDYYDEDNMGAVNQASAIADYDFGLEDHDGSKIEVEMISHTCAMSVKNARISSNLTQAQLAKKINEKTSVITEIENGACKYNAQLINRIEQAMPGFKIERGRKKKRK